MAQKHFTEQDLIDSDYEYQGEYGLNQIWLKKDGSIMIIYDPEEEVIVKTECNEPRYQNLYGGNSNPDIERRVY